MSNTTLKILIVASIAILIFIGFNDTEAVKLLKDKLHKVLQKLKLEKADDEE